ncbi:UDP-glucosyltransferase 2-like [Prorops nasuta]|uniref:UDP-glucosyltransferase 2-like n=1 Tax=Prorops nasuta TaxID=863751 RepID=UPI0034CF4B41
MMKRWLIFLSILCTGWAATEELWTRKSERKLKILGTFAHLGKSHFDVFRPLVEELADRGHEVTVVSHFPRSEEAKQKRPLPTYRDISLVDPKIGVLLNVVDLKMVDNSPLRLFTELMVLRHMGGLACEMGLRNQEVRKLIASNEKFDLILTEFFNTDCFLGFVHRFKAPYIALSSHQVMPWVNQRISNAEDPGYMPSIFLGIVRPMNFFDRLSNLLNLIVTKIAYEFYFEPQARQIAREAFGPDVPDLSEIGKNASAILVNTHFSLHGLRSSLSNIVDVGGLHIDARGKPLPKDIQRFLDDSPEGVLYFNLGSMIRASSMPDDKLRVILNVLESLPRKVIWKWESEQLPRNLKNLMVRKWLPQFDVLRHPNVKCYLGHGGLLGLSEGVYNGVPMILVPMYGDQMHNTAAAVTRGVAIMIPFDRLSEDNLRNALNDVFNNTKYSERAKVLSRAYRDRMESPLEKAVWWSEYIGRGNGLEFMRNDGVDLSWYQRELLDVGLFLLLSTLALLYLIGKLFQALKTFASRCRRSSEKSKKD